MQKRWGAKRPCASHVQGRYPDTGGVYRGLGWSQIIPNHIQTESKLGLHVKSSLLAPCIHASMVNVGTWLRFALDNYGHMLDRCAW